MHARRATAIVAATLAAAAFGLSTGGSAAARPGDPQPGSTATPFAVPAAGAFYPVDPARVVGTATGGAVLAPGSLLTVAASDRTGVPGSGISAVVVEVTAVASSTGAALTFAPSGSRPSTPLMTVPPGATRTSLLTVPVGASGAFDVALATTAGGNASPAAVTADLVGFYAADDTVVASRGVSGGYQPVEVTRLYDSDRASPLGAGQRSVLAVDLGPSANAHATALLVRVTAKRASAPGTLTLSPAGGGSGSAAAASSSPTPAPSGSSTGSPSSSATSDPGSAAAGSSPGSSAPPGASSSSSAQPSASPPATGGTSPPSGSGSVVAVSFGAGDTVSNLALVPAQQASDGRIDLGLTNTSKAPAGYAVDLVGFYDDGGLGPNLRFRPLPQTRILDTRSGLGGVSALAPGRQAKVTPDASTVGDSTFGLAGVVTTSSTGPADLSLWADQSQAGTVPGLPVAAGATSTSVQPEVGDSRGVVLLSQSGNAGGLGVAVDVVGSFEAYPPVTNPSARGWVDAVSSWQISATPR